MEDPQGADLPPVDGFGRPAMGPRRLRHLIYEVCREEMSRVEVAVAVIQFEVRSIIQNGGTIFADLIQSMGPGIAERRT